MKTRNILSALLIVASVLVAVILYFVVFDKYDKVFFEFKPMFWLCVITFVAGLLIFIGAVLIEKKKENDC